MVIDAGPYRLIRHPELHRPDLLALGVGVALGDWRSVALCLLPGAIAFTIRLLHEERVLPANLGEPYRDYMRRTKRLVPASGRQAARHAPATIRGRFQPWLKARFFARWPDSWG